MKTTPKFKPNPKSLAGLTEQLLNKERIITYLTELLTEDQLDQYIDWLNKENL